MKAGLLRMWWENPGAPGAAALDAVVVDTSRSPVTSLAMHSDALWALAGTEVSASGIRASRSAMQLPTVLPPRANMLFIACVCIHGRIVIVIVTLLTQKNLGTLMLYPAERTHQLVHGPP